MMEIQHSLFSCWMTRNKRPLIVRCKTNEMEPIEILCTKSQAQDNSTFLNGKNTTKCISRALFVWSRPLLRMNCLKRLCLMQFNGMALQALPTPLWHVHCCSLAMRAEAKQQEKEAGVYLTQMTSTHFPKCRNI